METVKSAGYFGGKSENPLRRLIAKISAAVPRLFKLAQIETDEETETASAEDCLIKRSQNGDDRAFEELIKPYEKLAYNIAYSKVANSQDAADVTQEIFIKVWRSLSGFRGDSSFSTWLCRIAVNTALDYIRKNRKATVVSLTVDDSDDERRETEVADDSLQNDPQLNAERAETIGDVRTAIADLPDEARTIITLRDMEGKSYTDIAEILGLELGTVKSRINRARVQLKYALSAKGYF